MAALYQSILLTSQQGYGHRGCHTYGTGTDAYYLGLSGGGPIGTYIESILSGQLTAARYQGIVDSSVIGYRCVHIDGDGSYIGCQSSGISCRNILLAFPSGKDIDVLPCDCYPGGIDEGHIFRTQFYIADSHTYRYSTDGGCCQEGFRRGIHIGINIDITAGNDRHFIDCCIGNCVVEYQQDIAIDGHCAAGYG